MDNLSIELDVLEEYNQGKINWIGEVLAKYEFSHGNRVLHLETNGEPGDIYLEIVDYDIKEGNLSESSFSEPLYGITNIKEIEDEFINWVNQD